MTQGFEDKLSVHRDLPRAHVVGNEGKAFLYDGVKIDRFLLQLTASEHGPMALDDLRGADALGLDIGEDLSDGVWRRTIRGDHHLKRLGVVHHRTERLNELMQNRVSQRRHRLAAAGVSGERQVPPAVDLGPLPGAALEQQPDDQERLDDQCAGRAQNRGPVFAATGWDFDSAPRCPAATDSRGCPTAAARASRISVGPGGRGGTLMLPGDAPFRSRMATSAVSRPRSSMDISLPPTMPEPRNTLCLANRGAFAVA